MRELLADIFWCTRELLRLLAFLLLGAVVVGALAVLAGLVRA
jgi:hypothetical protein